MPRHVSREVEQRFPEKLKGTVGYPVEFPLPSSQIVELQKVIELPDIEQPDETKLKATVFQSDETKLKATVKQAEKDRTIDWANMPKDRFITDVSKVVVQKKIDLTATGVIHTPASGKKIRIKGFAWSSNADIVTALRFGTGGNLLFPIQQKGVIGFNLIGCNIEGAVNEALYGYLSANGAMKGTVLIEEV